MRTLLLASAATLLATGAMAQESGMTSNPMQGGMIGTYTGGPASNNPNNALGSNPGTNLKPGTVAVRLNGRVYVEWGQGWNGNMSSGPNKVTSNQLGSWMRLYPGFDGLTANGLRYGGSIELRTNFTDATTPSGATPGSNASSTSTKQTVYVRRSFAYLGSDQLGIIRVGMADGLIGLFDGGVTTSQNYSPNSNFNGSDLQGFIGGNTAPPFFFLSGAGNEYDSQKIVYLSPQFAGFDFGLMYAPSAFNPETGCGNPSTTCANLTTSTTLLDGQRYTNLFGAGLRYKGDLAGVNVLAYGAYYGSGHVNTTGFTPATARAAVSAPASSTWNGQFDNISIGSMGVALTYAGVTVAGNYITGAMNGQLATKPSGGASMNAWVAGIQYALGPLTLGAAFETGVSQGAVGLTTVTQRRESGLDIGGSYKLAPGMVLFADYQYQERYQGQFNFLTNAVGSSANNKVHGQGFVVGTMVSW